ncbi:methanogenesis marker 12 protein [Methanomicrobium sp. W14]|uniref:methanogenesis marker 12 protein n=1 Tax=Methanomicrobium sp. W14 TaxID=2817839 RepID=UPI001AE152B7|nr:methanogenesis marker 12 protein [Methanomicrobium sp. W14]
MYIGIDHGTTAIRFATGEKHFKISRTDAVSFEYRDLGCLCDIDKIEGIAVCYSMGDSISDITGIDKVENRGVVTRDGAGEHIGGGTKVYDEVKRSGIPAIVIPGIHRTSPTDPRFKVYSHQTSPEKLGIAYEVSKKLGDDIIVCDASSNTVTLLISGGKITGAFDACIFAPGNVHGAIDVDGIRKIDEGVWSANEAFMHAGVRENVPSEMQNKTVAMFAAMECASMRLLNKNAKIAVAGSLAPAISDEISSLLGTKVYVYDEWCAAKGLSSIAEDVFEKGKRNILGLKVSV